MNTQAIAAAMKPKSKGGHKHLKEFHARQLHDGKIHVLRNHGKPGEAAHETVADNMADAHALMEEHMGEPNAGEEQMSPQASAMAEQGEAAQ